jgi:hypothetical protein
MPAAWNAASKQPVNCPARSLIRNLIEAVSWPRSIRTLRAACAVHAPSGLAVMPARWTAAGAVLDDDQGVDAPQQHGVHMDEVDRENPAGLCIQELLPGQARAAGAGSIPAACRICQTVEAAIGWPSLTSSPCTRQCPHAGLPVAMRITSLRIAAAVDGRPGCRRLV